MLYVYETPPNGIVKVLQSIYLHCTAYGFVMYLAMIAKLKQRKSFDPWCQAHNCNSTWQEDVRIETEAVHKCASRTMWLVISAHVTMDIIAVLKSLHAKVIYLCVFSPYVCKLHLKINYSIWSYFHCRCITSFVFRLTSINASILKLRLN